MPEVRLPRISSPLKLITWLMGLWIRPDVLPTDATQLIEPSHPVLYVLEVGGLADRAALNIVCAKLKLPAPTSNCVFHSVTVRGSVVVLAGSAGFFRQSVARIPRRLTRLLEEATQQRSTHLQIVPVAIYWGRSPDREASLLRQMFSENWRVTGRTAKFFKTLLHGRYTLVQFSQPLSLVPILDDELKPAVAVRKVSRILRVHFRNRRIATLGPDLSHRRTLIGRVLLNPAVTNEISAHGGGDARAMVMHRTTAERYAHEIAADISYSSVRVLRSLLTRLWNKLYDGVKLDGLKRVQAIADGRELVYVPCHRSHIDYLLLSYTLHMQGMSLPHIAAGINLNLPILGSLLRRGGAFFLRRSFRENRLYGLVFNAYLQEILQRGHALEYFIEGGRSRTGRLLSPKGGMLAMTAQSFLKQPLRPIMFVPVYFGYERLVEGGAFVSELSGGKKEKESLLGLFRSFKLLKQKFGSVYVNFGRPIDFVELLDRHHEGWRSEEPAQDKPDWLKPVVAELGLEIMQRINSAASVTPIGLLSFALLTTPHGRMALGDLKRLLQLLQDIQATHAYSQELIMTSADPAQIVEHGVELNYIKQQTYSLGDIVEIREGQAIPLSFFRNNVLHLYALPGCVACCFVNQGQVSAADIHRLVALVYPYLKNELYIHWSVDGLSELVDQTIELFIQLELLRWSANRQNLMRANAGTHMSFLLRALGQSVMPSLQRYYLTASVLSRYGSAAISAEDLGKVCGQCAERLEQIHGLRSPDFYNKELFNSFIDTLRLQEYINVNDAGLIDIREEFATVETEARIILGEQTRHSILNITSKVSTA